MKGRGWKPSLVSQGRREVVLAVRVREEESRALRTGVPPSLASSWKRRRAKVASVRGSYSAFVESRRIEVEGERGRRRRRTTHSNSRQPNLAPNPQLPSRHRTRKHHIRRRLDPVPPVRKLHRSEHRPSWRSVSSTDVGNGSLEPLDRRNAEDHRERSGRVLFMDFLDC